MNLKDLEAKLLALRALGAKDADMLVIGDDDFPFDRMTYNVEAGMIGVISAEGKLYDGEVEV